jgi:hypothetical protein
MLTDGGALSSGKRVKHYQCGSVGAVTKALMGGMLAGVSSRCIDMVRFARRFLARAIASLRLFCRVPVFTPHRGTAAAYPLGTVRAVCSGTVRCVRAAHRGVFCILRMKQARVLSARRNGYQQAISGDGTIIAEIMALTAGIARQQGDIT